MALSLTTEILAGAALIRLAGRFDAHAANEVEAEILAHASRPAVILDLHDVNYLSSGGIRVFVALHKILASHGGRLVLARLQPYSREVLRVSGLDQLFLTTETIDSALAEVGTLCDERTTPSGRFVFHHGSDAPGGIEILGHIEDVLAARITPGLVRAKTFSAKAYSIGLGALGPDVPSVMPYLGEMMTMGGTMVWLPTDGQDTPDFLVPQHDSNEVVIRTGFNVSIAGKFNEYIEFEAADRAGITLAALYRALFDLAKERRPDYRGAITLAMRAEVGEVYGSGVTMAPVATQAPPNGKWITDPENYPTWFEADKTPRHRDVTALICGLGLDLDSDLSAYDERYLNATFYLNPGNQDAGAREKLHNHGAFFKPLPLGETPFNFDHEIQNVVEQGHFIDMRHLFDQTTIVWALIGVVYVQDFHPDPASL